MQPTLIGRVISRSMYGIIITMALLAALENSSASAWAVALSIVATLFSISIAEAYTESIGVHIDKKTPIQDHERHKIFKESLYVFGGSSIPLFAFVAAGLGLWTLSTAFMIAKVASFILLFEYGYLYGRRSGRTRLGALKVGALNILLVSLIVAFKELVHV
ncbi:MAG: hypothetical protein ACK4NC_03355 [Candidatus Gracilibacteria bacterium]